ncbi:MAG TPA: hypothetical protein VEA69_02750 [Tepidisphaeraceae bacterium]|nr:hypothetical protein [Tepidisphaeraceae bacterium]
MGIDFCALIPFETGIQRLRELLPQFDRMNREIVAWWPPELSGIAGRPWTWNPEFDLPWAFDMQFSRSGDVEADWRAGDEVRLNGSRCLDVSVCRRALHFPGDGQRWGWFIESGAYRLFIRRVCQRIARIVGADRALYVPDAYKRASLAKEMVWEGHTVDQAEAWLLTYCGRPAPSANQIRWEPDGESTEETYFYDRFAGLPE